MSKATDYLIEQIREKDQLIASLVESSTKHKDALGRVFNEGWTARADEHDRADNDPAYPFGRDAVNPYTGKRPEFTS